MHQVLQLDGEIPRVVVAVVPVLAQATVDDSRQLVRQVFPGKTFLKRRHGLEGRCAVILHAALRPFVTAARTTRLFYRMAVAPRTSAPCGWRELS